MKYLLIVMAVLVSACSSVKIEKGAPEPFDETKIPAYEVGVGDQLSINVWRNAELSVSVIVRPDGKISMPLIGDIQAAKQTAPELGARITKKLKSYVRSPQVSVIVVNPSSSDFQRRVRITGAVRSPQSLAYRDGMTVLDLVLMAGGLNDFASANSAVLYRQVGGDVKIYSVHIDDLLEKGLLKTNYKLQPSDIITVPERTF